MKHLLLALISAITGVSFSAAGRRAHFTKDIAFKYRMGAGFPGDVNRTHPASISPEMICVATPPTAYGQAVLAAAANAGVRPFGAGDGAIDTVWGVTVRPFPTSPGGNVVAPGAASALGGGTPPATGVIDVCRSGYMMAKIPAAEAALALKGSAVFVRVAAAAADDPVGGFKAQADGGNTAALDPEKYNFNGNADANGNVEVCINI